MAEAGLHRHTVKDPWSSLSWLIWTLVALHILALGFWVRRCAVCFMSTLQRIPEP